ncbi:MAG: sensor histidine kinase [Candidatus Entotheonellia bacterium]
MPIYLSLRDKLIAVSIISVIIALVLSTLIDTEIARRDFTKRFRDEATRVAKELSAGFGGSTELDDWQTLVHKIHQIKEARDDIRQINVFAKSPENGWSLAASDEDPPTAHLSNQELANLMRGRTSADVEEGWEDARYWRVLTPIKVDKQIIGALQVLISWEAAQQDEAKERRQMLLTLAATVILVSIALTIFLQRAVYRPLKELVGAMQGAQAGSLDVEVVPHGRDELSQLAMHFNRMLLRIRQDTAEKEKLLTQIQQFNEELQGKIQQATRTLELSNQELQRVNEALFQSQRQLAQWERMAGMVYQSAAIAHEIGTPLHSIAGYIHLLLIDSRLPDDARRRLKVIESQMDRISETLRTMLASTKQPQPQVKPLDLNALLRDLAHLTSPGMSRSTIHVRSELEDDLPMVLADSNQLQQVFLNLIANAVDAMPAGGELQVKTAIEEVNDTGLGRPDADHRRCVAVSIRDTGQGIAEEYLTRIFDPFFTTKAAGQGIGIGLAVCSQIIHAHGGSITVQSQVGVGSTFTIRIPVHKEG